MVEILTAQETSIFNMLGKSTAINTVHATLTDDLASPASSAVAETGDLTSNALTTPSRLTNLVQFMSRSFKVSRAQQKIEHYHGENELTRQTTKAIKEWGNSAEFDLVRSTLTSGASGTTPKMSGVIEAISKSTNTTAHTSGTAWSASILKGMMKDNWDNSNGDVATDLFMGSYLKDLTDDFITKTNVINDGRNVRQIVNVVDVFETGLGKVKVHAHRYVQQSGDATGRVLAIRPEKLKFAFLERPFVDRGLARSGNYDFYSVTGSGTLEVHNQDSNWFASGFNIG